MKLAYIGLNKNFLTDTLIRIILNFRKKGEDVLYLQKR